jgi:hypothetical protein
MTQKSKLQALSIRLISMKSPDAIEETLASADNLGSPQDNLLRATGDSVRSPTNCKLLIHPVIDRY